MTNGEINFHILLGENFYQYHWNKIVALVGEDHSLGVYLYAVGHEGVDIHAGV